MSTADWVWLAVLGGSVALLVGSLALSLTTCLIGAILATWSWWQGYEEEIELEDTEVPHLAYRLPLIAILHDDDLPHLAAMYSGGGDRPWIF